MYKIGLVLAVILTLVYAFQGFYPEFMALFSNAFPPFLAGAAVFSSAFAFLKYGKHNSRQRFSLIWLCFTLGMALWFLGETSWAIYTLLLNTELPYPSLADVFWLAGYFPMLMALYLYVKTFGPALSWRTVGIAMVTVFILGIAVSAILITPIMASETDSVTLLVDFAYPLLDLVLFSQAVLGFAIFSKGELGKPWFLINAGILLYASGDLLFSYTTVQGTYYNGHPLDLLLNLGDLFLLLAFYVHTKGL
jgi:hypothetical protein